MVTTYYVDPLYRYDINYLSKKYARRRQIEYRTPTELEGMLYLKDKWKKIYKTNANIIKRKTYYSMKGHIRHRQYDIFFKYMNHLSLKNTYLFGLESEFEKYIETKSIPIMKGGEGQVLRSIGPDIPFTE